MIPEPFFLIPGQNPGSIHGHYYYIGLLSLMSLTTYTYPQPYMTTHLSEFRKLVSDWPISRAYREI